jgi:hypothetical protein
MDASMKNRKITKNIGGMRQLGARRGSWYIITYRTLIAVEKKSEMKGPLSITFENTGPQSITVNSISSIYSRNGKENKQLY